MPIIRPSRPEDIPAITAIYAHHVRVGTGTFELEPPSPSDMAGRRDDVLAKALPHLVATYGSTVIGFAYCNWFKPRPAYRFSAEDSIYMAPEAQGHGLGRALLAEPDEEVEPEDEETPSRGAVRTAGRGSVVEQARASLSRLKSRSRAS